MDELAIESSMTVDEVFDHVVATHPDREAVVCAGAHVTYRDMGDRVHALAAGLLDLGLNKGDKVAVILPNSVEFLAAFLGVPKAGGVVVPLNPQYRRHELEQILNDSAATAAILAPHVWGNDLLTAVCELRSELPRLRHIIVVGDRAPNAGSGTPDGAAGARDDVISLDQVLARGRGTQVTQVTTPDDLYGLIYTSGTTGIPKAAMHTHRTMLAPLVHSQQQLRALFKKPSLMQRARMLKTFARYNRRFRRWSSKPLTLLSPSAFHALAGYAVAFGALLSGSRIVVMERFHPVRVLELIASEHVNVLSATPTMYAMMLALPTFDQYDHSSLLYCGMTAAPCPPPLVREVRERFGCPTMVAFGATELAGAPLVTQFADSDRMQTESVGRVLGDAEVRVVDESHHAVPPGQIGELACKMESVMLGYYNAPEATAEVIDADGWYYTGDLAVIDAKGYVRIVGRKKDMIIRGGQNIFPAEVETYLQTHPKVQLAAVVGVPDALGGESVWAYIVPKPGVTLHPQEVLDHCRGQIAPYKVPTEVRVVAELPMTATAKVQKFRLREQAIAELEARSAPNSGDQSIVGADE